MADVRLGRTRAWRRESEISTSSTPRGKRSAGRPPKVAVSDIIATALEMFGTHGLHSTSIAAIANQLGMTDAGLLHHFPNRAALLDAAVARSADLHVELLQNLVAPGGMDALRGLGAWGRIMAEAPALMTFQTLVTADATLPDSPLRGWAQRRYQAVTALLTDLVREGIDRGEIDEGVDPEREARDLVAWLDGLRLQWLISREDIDLEAEVARHVDELLTRIGPD